MSPVTSSAGTLFLVVGPSGAGKDTLIDGARKALVGAPYVFAKRIITRPAGAPGEDHEEETVNGFALREAAGEFLITWRAHGLCYGLPGHLLDDLAAGRHVVANGSRATVDEMNKRVPNLVVVEVSAPPEVLAQRIAGRGRETQEQILARLERQVDPFPVGILSQCVSNDSDSVTGIDRFIKVLQQPVLVCVTRMVPIDTADELAAFASVKQWPAGTRLRLQVANGLSANIRIQTWEAISDHQSVPSIGLPARLLTKLNIDQGMDIQALVIQAPISRVYFSRALRGQPLKTHEYQSILNDANDGRYTETELTAFLVSVTRSLDQSQTLALAEARSRLVRRITWDEPMIVDKHSLGGVPGSRITPIVVPIVAAFGLPMPKASSRAITSAAGTADTMALLANVDLDGDAVRRCVREARACIAWNGNINHSVIDDVMNLVTRPYGLETAAWSVASILSKKVTAGVTHLVVDVPYGPYAKQSDQEQAQKLCDLFETTGQGLGIQVKAFATDGTQPIGRGIGPVLEVRDIKQVLARDPDAPQDLRQKALFFAAHILAWDTRINSFEVGLRVATELLDSGAAQQALAKIIDAQGPPRRLVLPSEFVITVKAWATGVVGKIDGWTIAGLARDAGAPASPDAGIDLLCSIGQRVEVGQPLYRVHVESQKHKDALQVRLENPADCGIQLLV